MQLLSFLIILFLCIIVLQTYLIRYKVMLKKDYKNTQTILQLIESSKDVIYHFEVKPNPGFKYMSPSIENFLGKGTFEEAMESPRGAFERIHPDEYDFLCKKAKGKIDFNQILIQRWKDNDGKYRWFEEYATPIYKDGEVVAVQGIMRNIDDKVKLQQDLEYRINHDALTGLYNREYFEFKFSQYNEQIDTSVAIMLCDLDELKTTNDNFGHKMGDALIKETADLLNQFSTDTITVARIGGDEFAFILCKTNMEEKNQLVNRVINKINTYNQGHHVPQIKVSIGAAFSQSSIGKMNELFVVADNKMYENKRQRKQKKTYN